MGWRTKSAVIDRLEDVANKLEQDLHLVVLELGAAAAEQRAAAEQLESVARARIVDDSLIDELLKKSGGQQGDQDGTARESS